MHSWRMLGLPVRKRGKCGGVLNLCSSGLGRGRPTLKRTTGLIYRYRVVMMFVLCQMALVIFVLSASSSRHVCKRAVLARSSA